MGHDTPHWEDFGRIPPQGGPQADVETTPERMGQFMGLSLAGGCNGVGNITGSVDLLIPPP